MAELFKRAIGPDEQLLTPADFHRAIKDDAEVYQLVVEMYSMIWYLAIQYADESSWRSPAELIALASKNWKLGNMLSPGNAGILNNDG